MHRDNFIFFGEGALYMHRAVKRLTLPIIRTSSQNIIEARALTSMIDPITEIRSR